MPGLMDNVATVNSVVRTFLALVVVGAIGGAGYLGWSSYNARERQEQELADAKSELENKKKEIDRMTGEIFVLNETVKQKDERIDHLDTALRLLKVDHRVARLTIVDQGTDEEGKRKYALVEFAELDQQGKELEKPRRFKVYGDIVYVDSWVVKFDDQYVEEQDIHRSTSLVLFRRVFGNQQKPVDGFTLDKEGSSPLAYSHNGKASELQRKIFADFWSVANNKDMQAKLGIRAAHGEAPSIKVEKGKSYRILLRASGGVSLSPDTAVKKRIGPET